MSYILTRAVLGKRVVIPIEQTEHDDIVTARKVISNALSIEQKFDFVMSNLFELEMSLAHTTAEQMLYDYHDRDWFDESRDMLNRRVMNLLSTARSYVDTLPQHINIIFGRDKSVTDACLQFLRDEYDARLGYRVMEAMRNYVQHEGMPIHGSTDGGSHTGEGDTWQIKYTLDMWLKPAELKGTDFKANVLAELGKIGEKIDLKLLIRDYVEGLAAANRKVREVVEEVVAQSQQLIASTLSRYEAACPGPHATIGVIVAQVEDEIPVSEHAVLLAPFEYRARLLKKNQRYKNLRRRFISTAVTEDSLAMQQKSSEE